jgi:hypothetical protein
MPVASAAAGSYSLRPDGDVTSQWSKTGASTAWGALDDNVTQPTSVGTADYISASSAGRVTEVSLATHALGNERIDAGTAWFYSAAGLASSGRAEVIWGGQVRGGATWGGLLGASPGWHSIGVTPPDQAALDDLRLRFTSTGGVDVTVRAAYFQLNTTPLPACPLATSGSTIGMTVSGCRTIAADTAAASDPIPFWGSIDCQTASRHQRLSSGGDTHLRADGPSQGDSAYRRLTVIDGDDFWGERCELGYNWNAQTGGSNGPGPGPTVFYHEGERRVTYLSIRLPSAWNVSDDRWRTVMQMKQTQPHNNQDPAPIIEMQVVSGQWLVVDDWQGIWSAPAQKGVWTRFAFDITYSQDPALGSIKAYVDLNGDGDFGDGGEVSPTIRVATLKRETSGSWNVVPPGGSIPSHLRAGLYHHTGYSCPGPSGCYADLDNVQVLAP